MALFNTPKRYALARHNTRHCESSILRRFARDDTGSMMAIFLFAFTVLFIGGAIAIDYSNQSGARTKLQDLLDAATLVGAAHSGTDTDKVQAAEDHFSAELKVEKSALAAATASFSVVDGDTLHGEAGADIPTLMSSWFFDGALKVGVVADAVFEAGAAPCIYVLSDKKQALLLNSGAWINAPECQIHVHSDANPAFIMNAGVTLNIDKLCVAGSDYIKNGGTVTDLEAPCAVANDPYFGKLPTPTVSSTCTTSGVYNPGSHTLSPGKHCAPIFNGSSTITFQPGLHVIDGTMIVNSGSTIIANGVTFYFPDVKSEIRVNGGLTMTATAPKSVAYKGILMYESTAKMANKTQYIFNGSNGEHLEGLIYLPNRDVTYNSTTNVNANDTTLVVNTMIINSANWKIDNPSSSGGSSTVVRLKR